MNDLKQLQSLDPARGWRPSTGERVRAQAFVDRLVAEEVPAPRRRPPLVRAAAAVVLAAGLVVAPARWLGGNSQAYASWTPTPREMPAEQVLPQAGACLRERPVPADIVLAEQRGKATLLIARRGDGDLVACTILDPDEGVAGAEVLDRTAVPGPAGASIQTMSATGGKAWYSEMIGRVAADVRAVDVILPGGTTVRASASGGWWAAWWPGREGGEVDTVRIVVHRGAGMQAYQPSQL